MNLDISRSTVELAGRRFPAVGLVCPLHPEEEPRDRKDRSLGVVHGETPDVYIPAENGVLIHVQRNTSGTLSVSIDARTCEEVRVMGDVLYLPIGLAVVGRGVIVEWQARRCAHFLWDGAEEDWVTEHIDRLSVRPYTEPAPGAPRVEMVLLRTVAEIWSDP